MTTTIVVASVMGGAVVSLLHAIRVGDRTLEVISKTVASSAFVVLGWVRLTAGDAGGVWLLAGLVLCALGDVLLLGEKTFEPGLGAFLLGHLLLIAGFHAALPFGRWAPVVAVVLVVGGGAAIRWLWPHLGHRKPLVVAYVVVISVMVWSAFSASWGRVLPWSAAAGSLLFYLSDLAVARQRFVNPDFVNRAIGLPLYYTGQFLLALVIGS